MSGTPPEDTTVKTVNEIINESLEKTTDAGGKWTGNYSGLDELEISDDKKDAVRSEMRRRHTDQTYTRNNQELIETKAEVEALKKLLPETNNLSTEDQEELDSLKYSDPDAWFDKMSKIRSEASAVKSKATDDALLEARTNATRTHEITRRAEALEEFNKSNSETPLTDDQLQFDIPPRLLAKVEKGEMSFDDMLVKAHDFINGKKRIVNPDYIEEPSFEGTPGNGETNTSKEVVSSAYKNMKF